MGFKEISFQNLEINPCKMIGYDWMLISAGDKDKYNTMTASWGHIGALWGNRLIGRPTVEVFVRPSRYTDRFIDSNDYFSLCFFEEDKRDDLLYLGSHSGEKEDKVSNTSLTVDFVDSVPVFQEAKMIIIAKKLYKGKIEKEGFIDKSIIDSFYKEQNDYIYNNSSFHNVYIGEIIKILVKE